MKPTKIRNILYVTIGAYLTTSIWFMLKQPFNDGSGNPDSTVFADYGTFMAGIFGPLFALISAYLIYITYKTQGEQIDLNKFENRLNEMIRANRAIVSEMEYEVPDDFIKVGTDRQCVSVKGQKIFVRIEKHFKEALKETESVFKKHFDNDTLFKNAEIKEKEIKLLNTYFGDSKGIKKDLLELLTKVNIVYLCIFYGVSNNGKPILKQIFAKTYNPKSTNEIIEILSSKAAEWDNPSKKNPFKYYGGHQVRLGHYYRQYFMIANFVNKQTMINYETKYDYIKQLRAQLSTYEQFVFFLNSMSTLGRIWEIDAQKNKHTKQLIDKRLITKYDLVKNIPTEFIMNVEPRVIYPLVEYEQDDVNPKKTALKLLYK